MFATVEKQRRDCEIAAIELFDRPMTWRESALLAFRLTGRGVGPHQRHRRHIRFHHLRRDDGHGCFWSKQRC